MLHKGGREMFLKSLGEDSYFNVIYVVPEL